MRTRLSIEKLENRLALNASPTIDPSSDLLLTPVSPNAGRPIGPVGTLVTEIVESLGFSDSDGDSPGIAITDTNTQGGTLWFSLNDGAAWYDIGEVTEYKSRVIRATPTARLYFQPSPDSTGVVSGVFTVKGWDSSDSKTSGTALVNTMLAEAPVASLALPRSINSYRLIDQDTRILVSSYSGLFVIDVTDPAAPSLSTLYSFNGSRFDVGSDSAFSQDGSLVFSGVDNHLVIADISDITAPTTIASLPLERGAGTVRLSQDGSVAWVASGDNGVAIVDISIPSQPFLTGYISAPSADAGNVADISTSDGGSRLFVMWDYGGIEIFDCLQPSAPRRLESIAFGGWGTRLREDGDYLFAIQHFTSSAGPVGVVVFQRSDGSLVEVARYLTPGQTEDTVLSRSTGYYFVSEHTNVYVFDAAQEGTPDPLSLFPKTNYGGNIAMSSDGTLLVMQSEWQTLAIFDVSRKPSAFSVDSSSFSVFLAESNTPAVISGDTTVSMPEDGVFNGSLTAEDSDGLATSGVFSILVAAEHGNASIDDASGAWTYVPNQNFFGQDAFTVVVTDQAGGGTPVRIQIDVEPVDDLAVFSGDLSGNFAGETHLAGRIIVTDADGLATGSGLTLSRPANKGSALALPELSSWVYIPGPLFDGSDDFVLSIQDQYGGTSAVTITISGTPAIVQPPVRDIERWKMTVNQNLIAGNTASYAIPVPTDSGSGVAGRVSRITATSSNTSLIPHPLSTSPSLQTPASIVFTPTAGESGEATILLEVEDGGQDNDLSSAHDNVTASYRIDVVVLEVVSNTPQGVLGTDSEANVYANTQPITYDDTPAKSVVGDFAILAVDATQNTLLVSREDTQYHIATDDSWKIGDIFHGIRNINSLWLDPAARTVISVTESDSAFVIGSQQNPTLVVRRGVDYTIVLNVPGHPFYLQAVSGAYQPTLVYTNGFEGNGQTTNRWLWRVPLDAPEELHYVSGLDARLGGRVVIVDN